MSSKNILLLGSGGRECALAWKLRQSPLCDQLFIAPGNAGTITYGTNLMLSLTDFQAIKRVCMEHQIDILLPGGEDTLVAGICDYFKNDSDLQHIIVVGPSREGAQLEGSKAFSKKFMARHHIPTAAYREFNRDNFDEGIEYINAHSLPIVVKADGLAAGKGVIIAKTAEEAIEAFTSMIKDAQFGTAGATVVIEEFLDGIELSAFVLTDGDNYVLLPEAKDYKRVGEGDSGPNTGGMGAISPVPFADETFMQKVREQVVKPTIDGLKKENISYQGFIFPGLIKVNGNPYVIEYNCRLGDPETEVVMPRLKNDLIELIIAMNDKQLNSVVIEHDERAAGAVMLVSAGYPGSYKKGLPVKGFHKVCNSILFHAGTVVKEGEVLTNGGRVLAITSYGTTLKQALSASYESAGLIDYEGKSYRRDIGYEFE